MKKDGDEYRDIYYKMAKNWVILRYDENNELQYCDEGYKKYQDVMAYINLLTFLSFPDSSYRKHSFLIPESFDFFEIRTVDKTIKNLIINLLVLSTAREKCNSIKDFRFCPFDEIYKRFLQLEKLLNNI